MSKIAPTKSAVSNAWSIRHDGPALVAACKKGVVQWDLRSLQVVREYPYVAPGSRAVCGGAWGSDERTRNPDAGTAR